MREFLDRLVKWTKNIKISDPFEEGCRLGPVVSGGQVRDLCKQFVSFCLLHFLLLEWEAVPVRDVKQFHPCSFCLINAFC